MPIQKQLKCHLVNGVYGDAALYCFFAQSGTAIQFDLGVLDQLSNRDLLKITHVFISHAHIDHFIGFDRLLRVNIPGGCHLKIFGPPGIIKKVYGKLSAYTWNLLDPGQMLFEVTEIDEHGNTKKSVLSNDQEFSPMESSADKIKVGPNPVDLPARRICQLDNGYFVDAVVLDHRTPVVAYSLQSSRHYQVNSQEIKKMGLAPGSWIGDLQRLASDDKHYECMEVNGQSMIVGELAAQVLVEATQRVLTYVTDLIFSKSNSDRLAIIARECGTFYCESCFKDEHLSRAIAKKHLTTKQMVLWATYFKAKNMSPFHFSNIYLDDKESVTDEINSFKEYFLGLDHKILEMEILKELQRASLLDT